MKAKRRRHDSAFKARVALEAMKEDKTIHQIAKENDVYPTQVTEWKKMLAENIAGVFEGSKRAGKEDFETERERLHSKIGQLTVEVDFLEKNQPARPVKRAELVETKHPKLSIRRQCELLHVTRSVFYYKPMETSESERRIMRALDEVYMIDPCMGSRRLVVKLREGYVLETNRKQVQRLRREMGIETIWCRPRRTSLPDNGHRKYPYLLKGQSISEADEAWCTDITYIPMPQGHAYLCAVMDWHTRYVLGWSVSNTMDAALTSQALENAVRKCRKLPEIFNTDQGSQFTSPEWVGKLEGLGIKVSMDGKGRWMDNVFIERLWRTLKYEDVYLKEYGTLCDLRQGLGEWFKRYNAWRTHQALGNRTPEKAYLEDRKEKKEAA